MKKKQLILLEVFGVAFAIIIVVTASSPLFPSGVNINTPENFPDENFRWAAERLMGVIPKGHFTAEQAAEKQGELNFIGMKVHSVKGLEYFKSITALKASKNKITALDLSNQPMLQTLICSYNLIDSLDISKCPFLNYLDCRNSQLTSLDVTNNPQLANLFCDNNQLTELNLSHNFKLYTLHCRNNNLLSLDISNNIALDQLNCSYNKIRELKLGNIPSLRILNCYDNHIQELDISHLKSLNVLQIRNNPLIVFPKSNSNVFVNIDITESDLKR